MANAKQHATSMSNNIARLNVSNVERHARMILINLAETKSTIIYSELADRLGLPTEGNALGNFLSPILIKIAQWCKARGLPPLTCLVVRKSGQDEGLPGRGFWEEMGFIDPDRNSKRAIFENYRQACYLYWDMDTSRIETSGWTQEAQNERGLIFNNEMLNQRVILDSIGVHTFSTQWKHHIKPGDRVVLNSGSAVMLVKGISANVLSGHNDVLLEFEDPEVGKLNGGMITLPEPCLTVLGPV